MPKSKKQLQFNYSTVFQGSFVPIWIENIAPLYHRFSTLKNKGIKDLQAYLKERPDEICRLASKIEVLDVNDATVAMYEARNKDEFLGKLDQMMPTIDKEKFTEALVSFWNQEPKFSLEATHRTIHNKPMAVIISSRIPRFGSDELVIPITVTDVTALREEQKALKVALEEIKTLRGIIPICASCKKVRDDRGYWNQIEKYISDRTEAMFTHGICPDCSKRLYPIEKLKQL